MPVDTGAAIDDALIDAIAGVRVGGSFWGARIDGVRLVVRSGVAVPAQFADVPSAQIGLLPGHGEPIAGEGRALPADADPWTLAAGAEAVCAAPDDEIALIAGLLGTPVYGADGALVDAGLLRETLRARLGQARYRDCFSGGDVEPMAAVMLLADWRRHLDGNQGLAAACGMAFWKRDAIARFLWDGRRAPPFLSPAAGLRRAHRTGGAIAIWPSRVPASLPDDARREGVVVATVEDGFLRSRGLGAALHPPGSVVIDRQGIYYDAGRPSDLETLLAEHRFDPALEARARALRALICAAGVTKYGPQAGEMIAFPADRRVVLAVGQVDDDLSVRLGGAGVAGNLDFLERVRAAEPEAWIIYRPHPDVEAGHRKGHIPRAVALRHADAIDEGSPLMQLVEAVDGVHVLSSLTGFEALLRERPVTVHGMPFYAGWGLTRDLARPTGRRGRLLTLDQLVAGTLILYPRYLDPETGLPCGPELMVKRMTDGSTPPTSWLIGLRVLQGKLRRFMTLFADRLHG